METPDRTGARRRAGRRRFAVVGLGEILWDLLPAGRKLGGAPANFAYHAAALGAAGSVVSCVGADRAGRDIKTRLARLDVASRLAVDPVHPTGTVAVRLDPRGKPSYVIREGVAWDFIPWSESLRKLAARSEAVCYGTLAQRAPVSRATIRAFLRATPPDCLRVFDINLRQSFFSADLITSSLRLASAVKISDEELPEVARLLGLRGGHEAVLRALRSRYRLRLAALTRGGQGSLLVSSGGACAHPGIPVRVADTVGAGDAFTAGLVVGVLRGWPLDRVSELANRLAAYVCSRAGATPPLPPELAGS